MKPPFLGVKPYLSRWKIHMASREPRACGPGPTVSTWLVTLPSPAQPPGRTSWLPLLRLPPLHLPSHRQMWCPGVLKEGPQAGNQRPTPYLKPWQSFCSSQVLIMMLSPGSCNRLLTLHAELSHFLQEVVTCSWCYALNFLQEAATRFWSLPGYLNAAVNLGSSANETAKGSGSRLCLVGPECQEGYARAMGVGWSPKICVASKVKGSVDKGSLNSNMR